MPQITAAAPSPTPTPTPSPTPTPTPTPSPTPTPTPTPTPIADLKPPATSAITPKVTHPLVQAAATGTAQPLPLWMESAMKLGKRFLRVAAAGLPEASLGFVPRKHGPAGTGCCRECGCDHPPLVDEYYFWLINTLNYDPQDDTQDSFQSTYQFGYQDSYYDPVQQQASPWDDDTQVPELLAKWQPTPAVRLAWCRFHNGKFKEPRSSDECVEIDNPADIVLLGRVGDSLYFSVSGAAPDTSVGDTADTSFPGFRYDLPSDHAVAIPLVVPQPTSPTPTPTPTSPYPGQLPSYPLFVYDEPGARLFPGSWFSPALAVASALRAHCCFEPALRWYRCVFDPLIQDCAWVHCETQAPTPTPTPTPTPPPASPPPPQPPPPTPTSPPPSPITPKVATQAPQAPSPAPKVANPAAPQEVVSPREPSGGACCDSTDVSPAVAKDRSIVLHFLETLREYGDALLRRNSPEAFQHARLLFDTAQYVLGKRPCTVRLKEPAAPPPISSFKPCIPPLNPRLLDLYDVVRDRLDLIHHDLSWRRLRNGRPQCDMPYFGDNPLREGWRTTVEPCADATDWCHLHSPYRFDFLIQKAKELAGGLRELGSALLSALEKGDAESLASIRAGHERDLLVLGLSIRQDQWRDADRQVQALQQTKDLDQTNLLYYTNLYQNGLINDEIQNQSLTTAALQRAPARMYPKSSAKS